MSLTMKRTATTKDVVRVVSGNFLEMFDFMVYGFYAATIAKAVFPNDNEFVSLMLSLTTFGAGFLMRPLGAVVLGAYIDRHGRRAGLIVSLGIMSAGVALIAFTPTYASIGMAAPILVVVGRLLQGFSAGAESGAVSVYLSEIAPSGRRGFYVSWQSASQQVAVIFAAVIGVTLRGLLTEEQMVAWGWRIPFLIGCLIVPVLFWIRRSLQESAEFVARVKHRRATLREIYRSLLRNWGIVLKAVLLVTLTSVFFYMITAYTPTYASQVLGLSDRDSFILTIFVGIANFVWVPIMGALSDRVGRLPVLMVFSSLVGITAYPVMAWLVSDPSFGRALATLMWMSFLYGGYQGVMVVTVTEIMPAEVRATGFSLAYSLAQAIFGGFTPAICTYLVHVTGNRAMPGLWLASAAVFSIAGALSLYRNANPASRPAPSAGLA
ncbi:MAG: MFS transporter [Acidobacteriota bacterium]